MERKDELIGLWAHAIRKGVGDGISDSAFYIASASRSKLGRACSNRGLFRVRPRHFCALCVTTQIASCHVLLRRLNCSRRSAREAARTRTSSLLSAALLASVLLSASADARRRREFAMSVAKDMRLKVLRLDACEHTQRSTSDLAAISIHHIGAHSLVQRVRRVALRLEINSEDECSSHA